MEGITSSVGSSGLKIGEIVDSLVAVEKSRKLDRYKATAKNYTEQLDNYDKLKQLITDFKDKLGALNSAFKQNANQATSSDQNIFTASISGGNLTESTYKVNITQLAQNHQMASGTYGQKDAALNLSGAISIKIGSTTFTVNVSATDTLEKLRDKINISSNNNGISASILSTNTVGGTPEYRLVLASNKSGTANEMTITGAGAVSLDLTHELTAAKDAKFTLNDTLAVTRSSNIVTDVLEGVSLQLNTLGTANLKIAQDSEERNKALKTAISDMVKSYNAIMSDLDEVQANSTTRDTTNSLVKQALQAVEEGSSNGLSLASLGISLSAPVQVIKKKDDGTEYKYTVTGKLVIDDEKLSKAIANNYSGVRALFTDTSTGFINSFTTKIADLTKFGGTIWNKAASIRDQERYNNDRIDRESVRLDNLRLNLTKQYAALDAILKGFQDTSNYLASQMSSFSGSN